MTPKEFLDLVHVCEGLKNVTRHCDTSAGRRESVAEHCWRLSLMAALLRPQAKPRPVRSPGARSAAGR